MNHVGLLATVLMAPLASPSAAAPSAPVNADEVLASARAQERLVDYPKARTVVEEGLTRGAFAADGDAAIAAQMLLARVTLFDDPVRAGQALDAALRSLRRQAGKAPRDQRHQVLADVYSLKGRLDLNQGRFQAALNEYQRALEAAGGLTRAVTISDTRVRSDLAIALHLLNRDDFARRYFAYSGTAQGAAHIDPGADMPIPACGRETGIDRADVAVVEFAIGDDGRVIDATPIYASRPQTADDFARAVANWKWTPEAAAKLSRFWRSAARVELRCLTADAPAAAITDEGAPSGQGGSSRAPAVALPPRCSTIEPRPIPVGPAVAARFPSPAATWGFSGWVRVSHDIDRAGTPANARTVTAYPPFVFDTASERNVANLRFPPMAAVDNLGCTDRLQLFRYGAKTAAR